MRTAFTQLVGIDVPIVQAPIGGLAQPPPAAAVSNAGALGMLAITWLKPDEVQATGQSVGLVNDVRPAGELVRAISDQAEAILRGLAP